MLKVVDYARIRRAYRDGMSIREIARSFGHSRQKIREVLETPEPRPYQRNNPSPAPKLTHQLRQRIDEILDQDASAPVKQRHTATAIYRRLAAEDGYLGGYDQVRRYVAKRRRRQRETFIPLCHDPGQRAEADFGHIYVDFPDGRRQVPVLIHTWAWSNCSFAIALPSEKIEAILHGTSEAFSFFDCVPKELWWDNPKTVATTILQGRQRELNRSYLSLASHYNFEPLFCMPARGNEKPHVENRVKYLQRNWATPVPKVRDLDELNRHLLECCRRDQQRTTAGNNQTIGTRFQLEKTFALPLPVRTFDAAVVESRKADKYQTVTWDRNQYSVPRSHAFQTVSVKAYVDRVEIIGQGQLIARHQRSYEIGAQVLDPLHYLSTLGRKPACLDHSQVYRNWHLPAEFGMLRSHLEIRHGRLPGARQYIRVLQLLAQHPVQRVAEAMRHCRREGVASAERVIYRCQRLAESDFVNDKPTMHAGEEPRRDHPGSWRQNVPAVQVPMPDLSRFDSFLPFHQSLITQGGETDEQTRRQPFTEDELKTTPAADDPGRTPETGPRGGPEQPGLFGLLAASERVGTGHSGFQCIASANPQCRFPGG